MPFFVTLAGMVRRKWADRSPWLIMLLGFGSSLVGVGTSYIVFPENVGLMGLAFASLIMQPLVAKLLATESKQEYRLKRYSLKHLFKDHSQTFKTMLLLFLGIFFAYAIMGLYLNELRVKDLFGSQLAPYINVTGSAGESQEFLRIFSNNFVVLLVTLLLSLFYGAGAILFLAWNASVWGTVFAFVARETAFTAGSSKIAAFSALFLKVFPHTILEASAYFLAVISGVVIAKALIKESADQRRFQFVLTDGLLFYALAMLLMILGAAVEAYIYPLF